jgi:hypothetical protein
MLDPACAALIPVTLAAIDDALTALSRVPYAAADALVPPGLDDSIARRFARAAPMWPSPRRGIGPAHEQQARVLVSLHDAGAALRAAAGQCGRAAGTVAATMEPDRHATPFSRRAHGAIDRRDRAVDDLEDAQAS